MSRITNRPLAHTKPARRPLRCRSRGALAEWLGVSGGCLVISTYTSGKLVLVGSHEGRLRFRTWHFARPMGLAIADRRLALAVRGRMLVFRDSSRSAVGEYRLVRDFDTGRVDAHDVAFGRRGVYFANTKFNCIARATPRCNFVHCWQPTFLREVVKRDRCHLNGIGMRGGLPAVATAFCLTDHAGGWREENRMTSGVLMDVARNEVIAGGLCMPHSPRWHDGQWWICNSGHGSLERVDAASGERREHCALPGFARGLAFVGEHALVGLSKIRRKHILDAPPVRTRHRQLFAGAALVDLAAGKMVGALEFLSGGNEVFDVAFVPHIKAPRLVGGPSSG